MYMIYGRMKGDKRMSPVDLENGGFVNRLLFGSFFDDKETADKVVKDLNEHNPGMEFEWRKK